MSRSRRQLDLRRRPHFTGERHQQALREITRLGDGQPWIPDAQHAAQQWVESAVLHRLLRGAQARGRVDVRPAFPLLIQAAHPSMDGLRLVVPVGRAPAFGALLTMQHTADTRPPADEISIRHVKDNILVLTTKDSGACKVGLECSWKDLRMTVEADPYVSAPSAVSLRFDASRTLQLPSAQRAALSGLLRRIKLFVEPGPLDWLFAWHEWVLKERSGTRPRLPAGLRSDLTDELFGLQPTQLRALGIEDSPSRQRSTSRERDPNKDNNSSALRPEPTHPSTAQSLTTQVTKASVVSTKATEDSTNQPVELTRVFVSDTHAYPAHQKAEDAAARTADRQLLGRTLRKSRTDAGFTQAAVAERLGCGQAKVNKIETTLCSISMEQLDVLIEMYKVAPDMAVRLREWAAQDLENGPRRTKMSAYTMLTDLELEATEILCWHSERIPGPLKSEMYALKQRGPGLTDSRVIEVLRRHKARKQMLTMPDPPRYRAILSESSLYRLPGGFTPDMVHDQASYLLQLMTKYRQLELRILPFAADVPFVDNDFQLLLFDDPEISDFVYVEGPGGGRKSERKLELDKFREHWAILDMAALDVSETKEFLADLLS